MNPIEDKNIKNQENNVVSEPFIEALKLPPLKTKSAVHVDKLFFKHEKPVVGEMMSTRIVKSASHITERGFIVWQLAVPKEELASIDVFASCEISNKDLKWILEKQAKCSDFETSKKQVFDLETKNISGYLYELKLFEESTINKNMIGFSTYNKKYDIYTRMFWPIYHSNHFKELLKILREEGAIIRVVFGKADNEVLKNYKKSFIKNSCLSLSDANNYLGDPIKARSLIWLSKEPSIRLRTIISEIVNGMYVKYIGKMNEIECIKIWNNPIIKAELIPEMAARAIMFEPIVNTREMVGIDTCDEIVKPIPAQEIETIQNKYICIGNAINSAGQNKDVCIGDKDIRCHYEIIGASGTGKSTLISKTIIDSIKKGYGLTFFDPHGSTVDLVIKMINEKFMNQVRVIRLGDKDNPVPLSIWDGKSIEDNERNISDLTLIFEEIFDPHHGGIVGPRWERWFSTFAKASIALFGMHSSFESIIAISSSQDIMIKVANLLSNSHPELFRTIRDEYVMMNKSDFSDFISWAVSKFQCIISIPELRKTIGAGVNALNFKKHIDENTVTLIDLATPKLGTHASRVIGCLLLMQLWNAALCRKNREKTHLVFIDEAHLFQNNPLPRMLAEGRKFGIGIVLAHQHCGQLSSTVLDALEANTANFSAFRLSSTDAKIASVRMNDSSLVGTLSHMDSYNAITTLSVDGKQSKPFTLKIDKPLFNEKTALNNAKYIEDRSINELVLPYKRFRAYTQDEFITILSDIKNEKS